MVCVVDSRLYNMGLEEFIGLDYDMVEVRVKINTSESCFNAHLHLKDNA